MLDKIDEKKLVDAIVKLFRNKLNLDENINLPASLYYYLLIKDNYLFLKKEQKKPASYVNIKQEAMRLYPNIKKNGLITGRRELLKNGIIAQVFFAEDDSEIRNNFKGETFLPINPYDLYSVY